MTIILGLSARNTGKKRNVSLRQRENTDMSEKEKGTNNSRFREIISVLRKHNITHGISPKKLRLIMEDLGPTFVLSLIHI
mgnify:FL=1